MIFMLEVDGVLRECKVHHGRMADELHYLNYCRAMTDKGSAKYEELTRGMEKLAKEIVDSGFFEVWHA